MHPTKTEDKYLEFEKLSRILQIPVPLAHLAVQVKDKDGKITESFKDRSHSWNRNFYNCLYCFACYLGGTGTATFGAGHLNTLRSGGAINTISNDYPELQYSAALGDNGAGILIGTGTDAESFEGYNLAALIAHGTGSGEMSYGASPAGVPAYTSGTRTWDTTFERIYNNNSGGSIVVAEACLAADENYFIMTSRDLLSSAVTVADAGQLKITYTISMVFPE